MANPEHVEIVKAGKKAIDEWRGKNLPKYPPFALIMDLSDATFSTISLADVVLSHTNLRGATFRDSALWGVRMLGCDLREANLRDLEITCSNFNGSDISGAHFEGSLLSNAQFEDVHGRNVHFTNADLSFASLMESEFMFSDFQGADLRFAQFLKTDLSGSNLDAVKLSPIDNANWNITNVSCTHFFYIDANDKDNYFHGKRIPSKGYLANGEFEDRFKSRPTIEFIFKHGMHALAPAVLGAAIDRANQEKPESKLRLLNIDAKGGIPRAIIEIAEKVPKEDALALVRACYKQKIQQMQKEIKGLKKDKQSLLQIASQKMLLPSLQVGPKFMSVTELAEYFGIDNKGALRKRLERFRGKHKFGAEAFREVENRGIRQAKFLYNVEMVTPIVKRLKQKQASSKRTSK